MVALRRTKNTSREPSPTPSPSEYATSMGFALMERSPTVEYVPVGTDHFAPGCPIPDGTPNADGSYPYTAISAAGEPVQVNIYSTGPPTFGGSNAPWSSNKKTRT